MLTLPEASSRIIQGTGSRPSASLRELLHGAEVGARGCASALHGRRWGGRAAVRPSAAD